MDDTQIEAGILYVNCILQSYVEIKLSIPEDFKMCQMAVNSPKFYT